MATDIQAADPRENGRVPASFQGQEITFIQEFGSGPKRTLLAPFGVPNWTKIGPALACSLAAILIFTRTLSFGTVSVHWHFGFDVNYTTAGLALLAGVLTIAPRVRKNLRSLRERGTVSVLILLAIVTVLFAVKVLDLGVFDYALDKFEIGTVVGLLFLVALGVLAFVQRSGAARIALAGFFLWWGFSIGDNGSDFGFKPLSDLFDPNNDGVRLLRELTPPRWSYFAKVIDPMLLTVQTAVAATVIGIGGALPLSIFAARNTTPHPLVYIVARFLINTIRAIPPLVLALLFIPFVGLGPAAGILGLGIHAISTLSKLFAEAFEQVKPQPMEALRAAGADDFKTFRWGVFPQAFPLVASYSIYAWESNVRDATTVAFVGGGGIGFLLQSNLNLLEYANVSVLLIVLILTVALLDRVSDFIRAKII